MVGKKNTSWLSFLTFGYLRGSSGDKDETSNAIQKASPSSPVALSERKGFLDGRGLHPVLEPIDAEIDIVFVHGLTGSRKTWYHAETKTFWPVDLLPQDIQAAGRARIFFWEYDADIFKVLSPASIIGLSTYGANFCGRLAGHRLNSGTQARPIIFVCHSLGGLVTMRALLHANEKTDFFYADILDSTVGIIFLGTPLRGSSWADWGSLGADIANFIKDANKEIVKLLHPDSGELFQLRDSFMTMIKNREANRTRGTIVIKCYFEELGMGPGFLSFGSKVVTRESAVLEGYHSGSIRANHVTMTKFSSRRDPGYVEIKDWIFALISQAVSNSGHLSRSPLPEEGLTVARPSITNGVNERMLHQLIPDNFEGIHRQVTATAIWNMKIISPSYEFMALTQRPLPTKSEPKGAMSHVTSIDTVNDLIEDVEASKRTRLSEMLPSRQKTAGDNSPSQRDGGGLQSENVEFQLPERQQRIEEVSNWLSDIDHQKMHDFSSSKRYKDSGVWLSKAASFQAWRDSSHSTIFWLRGMAGSGKSVMSSFVVDALSPNERVTVLYFYCGKGEHRSSGSILRSFLKQMYLHTQAKNIMEDFYDQHRAKTPCSDNGDKITLWFDLFLQLISTSRTYIILDGLDECNNDSVDVLLSAWSYIAKRSSKVIKLFISSRERSDIKAKIERESKASPRGFGEMSLQIQPGHLEDLDSYVRDQAESVAKDWKIWQESSQLLVAQAGSMILKQASGSFLWAKTTIEAMRGGRKDLEQRMSSSIPTIPESLEVIYDQILNEIVSGKTPEASIVEKTLYWVIFALEELRSGDVLAALCLGLDEDDEKFLKPFDLATLVGCCKGLITTKEDRLLLAHSSTKEYLCQRLNSSLGHVYLAKMCLAILTSMEPDPTAEQEANREMTSDEALYGYAQRNYLIHGFKALSLDQRIGPYIEADVLPSFEKKHRIGNPATRPAEQGSQSAPRAL